MSIACDPQNFFAKPRPFRTLAAAAVSAFLLFWILQNVEVSLLLQHIKTARLSWLIPAFFLNLFFPPLAALRWHALLKPLGFSFPYRRLLFLCLAAWPAASVLPAKTGDFIRALDFRKENAGRLVFFSLILERMLDIAVLGAMVLMGTAFLFPRFFPAGLLIYLGFGAAGFGALRTLARWFQTPFNLRIFFAGVSNTLPASLGIWALSLVQWQWTAQSLGETLPAVDSLFRLPIALAAGTAPIAWAGIGPRDAAFLWLYETLLAPERILAVSFLFTSLRYLAPGVLGLPWTYLWIRRRAQNDTTHKPSK